MKVFCPKNQRGQTILFVVVALTIALSVAVTVSARTLSSISRASRADTTNRAISAAEGGVERVLALTPDDFKVFVGGNCPAGAFDGEGPDGCLVKYDITGQPIKSQASLKASVFSGNSDLPSEDYYKFNSELGTIKEVNLKGYSASDVRLCFSNPQSALFYLVYSKADAIRGGIYKEGTHEGDLGGFDSASPDSTKGYCATVDVGSNPLGIRIGSLYNSTEVKVQPTRAGASLPDQGYLITSKGTLIAEGGVQTTRTLKVYKSYPYLLGFFDFAILTDGILN